MSDTKGGTVPEHAGRPQLERVVIGVDFSAPSVAAVSWAREHFAPQAECLLVHSLDLPTPPAFLRGAFASRPEVLKSARAGAAVRLERLRAGRKWGPVRCDVREGRPEDAIAAAARDMGADLVIVGEHGHPRGVWGSLGSTAEALVRTSPVPVLLARSVPDHPPARILVAVDESEHATVALAWARMLAERFDAAITALHVFRPVYLGAARAVSGMKASRELEQQQLHETTAWLEQTVTGAGFATGQADTRIDSGDPASALVAAQRGGAYDVVVMGSRGAGGAGRMLLGSVASGVLRGASCPSLVVRADGPTVV